MKQNIVERLTSQLIAKGFSRQEAQAQARKSMVASGNLTQSGKLTEKGQQRSAMTPEQRAIDRQIQRYGGIPSDYVYNPHTNQAFKK